MTNNSSDFGYFRVAVAVPELRVADVEFNVERICVAAAEAFGEGAGLVLFPELSLTGYSCGDLFYQSALLDAVEAGLEEIVTWSAGYEGAIVVGLPLRVGGRLYNCAAVVCGGRVAGIVPKSCLPDTEEFYEERWFSRGDTLVSDWVRFGSDDVPIGTDLLFTRPDVRDFCMGIEVCEDLWGAEPISGPLVAAGATVIVNPSASNEVLGKAGYRRSLVSQQSARCLAGYLYASAGPGESSTDLVFSGHGMICEAGKLLAETDRFEFGGTLEVADLDLELLANLRLKNSTFSAGSTDRVWRTVVLDPARREAAGLKRVISAHPFIPDDSAARAANCAEIFAIQSTALATRLRHLPRPDVVIGVSGGLDSTLALLVACRAMDKLGAGRDQIHAVGMPGPGSTGGTQSNAEKLSRVLGCAFTSIPIHDAVEAHLAAIGHPQGTFDVTFENAQARERTQILMNLANRLGAIVVGTGDLSEAALGWCTYNGDQMSMYHVNVGVPKTLVRHLVSWCADDVFEGDEADLLRAICDTPITPELLPLDADGGLAQKTEDQVGPYELHDFFLFHAIRHGFGPRKIFYLARLAFDGKYDDKFVIGILREFFRRFFTSQFKRSAMPDGPKVGTVALSPRGDWRMPSDASAAIWLGQCDELLNELEGAKR